MKRVVSIFCLAVIMMTMFIPIKVQADGEQPTTNGVQDISGIDIQFENTDPKNNSNAIKATGLSDDKANQKGIWNKLFNKAQTFITGLSGLLTLASIGFFIYYIFCLSKSAGNPQENAQAKKSLIITGIALGLFGSVTIWSGFFYNFLK